MATNTLMNGEPDSPPSSPETDPLSRLDSLVSARVPKAASTNAVSFGGLLEPALLLHEDLKEGCGGQLWPAGMVLAKYMLCYNKDNLVEKTILEIGAGGGLVGLAVGRGCRTTKPILITDQLPMLNLMQQNTALNSLESKVIAEVLDWGTQISPSIYHHLSSTPAASSAEQQYPDVILAADCVYFEPAFPLLLQTMHQLLGPKTVCYFCFKKRRKADWRFIKEMKKKFDVLDASYDDQDRDSRESIYLYEVRKMKSKH